MQRLSQIAFIAALTAFVTVAFVVTRGGGGLFDVPASAAPF